MNVGCCNGKSVRPTLGQLMVEFLDWGRLRPQSHTITSVHYRWWTLSRPIVLRKCSQAER